MASKHRLIEEAREAEHDRPKEHEPPVFGDHLYRCDDRSNSVPGIRGRNDGASKKGSFEYIFESSGSYEEVIPTSDWRTTRFERAAASTPDQFQACQMMTEVHTVSIVPKKRYDANICSCQAPLAKG